jgi:hypothetical protein
MTLSSACFGGLRVTLPEDNFQEPDPYSDYA